MTIGNFADKKTYWHKGDCPYKPNINFDEYMRINRFDDITRMHVFVIHDGERQKEDPLYQILDFLDQFNDNLAGTCTDESTNQRLGKVLPNLKKVSRKPHPIGQEYKCTADNVTCCILRLDFVSDPKPKKFDDSDRKLIATVKRLAEPCFQSGRTIIADSWFGSPAMTRALLQNGNHSIMQITKRRYWPQGMPATDIISRLDEEYGSVFCMKSLHDSTRQFRDKEGIVHSISQPHVYEVYEKNKNEYTSITLSQASCLALGYKPNDPEERGKTKEHIGKSGLLAVHARNQDPFQPMVIGINVYERDPFQFISYYDTSRMPYTDLPNIIDDDGNNDTNGNNDDSNNSDNGNDSINSDNGNDSINSDNGNDSINSDNGNDSINSDNGNDSINSDNGNDSINSDNGNDSINSDNGNESNSGNESNNSNKDRSKKQKHDDMIIPFSKDRLLNLIKEIAADEDP